MSKPKKKRDPKVVEQFLKKKKLKNIPKGNEIDHIIPLVDGGLDNVSNMQLLTKKQHEKKTAEEAKARALKKKKKRKDS